MKTLIVLSAVMAVALATPGYLGAAPAAYAAYGAPAVVAAPIHAGYAAYGPAPVAVGPGGYLLDTPDVAVTKAAHLTAVAQTRARDAIINSAPVLAAPVAYAGHAAAVAAPLAYAAPGALAAAAHLQAKAALLG